MSIDQSAFANMSSLKHLDLSDNRFLTANHVQQALKGYTHKTLETLILRDILMSDKNIPTLVTNELKGSFSSLRHLDLGGTGVNWMTNTNATPEILPKLVTLDLTGTRFYQSQHCINLLLFKKLEVLRFDNWPLSSESNVLFRNCTLMPSQNGCYQLPPNLKELRLENFNAKHLRLDLGKDVCISSKLEFLSVPRLRVDGSISALTGLDNLKTLDISFIENPFSTRFFRDMASLETLNVSSDSLHKIENNEGFEGLFEENINLKWTDLHQNGLQEIPFNFFAKNSLLEDIDLSWNRLQHFRINLTTCWHLKTISLTYNSIKLIDQSVLTHLENIHKYNSDPNKDRIAVSIYGNGMTCNCENAEFLTWIQNTNMLVEKEKLICDADLGKAKIEQVDVTTLLQNCPKEELSSTAKNNNIPLILGGCFGSAVFVVALITVLLLLKRRKQLRDVEQINDVSLNERIFSNEDEPGVDEYEMHAISPVPDNVFYIGLNESLFKTDERQPRFAAFLAYSHEDRDFVIDKLYYPLQKRLRESFPDWNEELLTVLYDKNFLPGQCTKDVCRAAVYSSYVTVAIVSDAFSRSTWCHYEIETAIEARVPIVPVYLSGVDADRFPAVMKYIYENNVRIFWPDTKKSEKLSNEEISVVRDLAFSVSTYVKQQTTNNTRIQKNF